MARRKEGTRLLEVSGGSARPWKRRGRTGQTGRGSVGKIKVSR